MANEHFFFIIIYIVARAHITFAHFYSDFCPVAVHTFSSSSSYTFLPLTHSSRTDSFYRLLTYLMPSCLPCANSSQSLSAHLSPAVFYHFLLPVFFLCLSRLSPSHYAPAICPRVHLPCAGCCRTFSACSSPSSPPTLLVPLVSPSCQFLSGDSQDAVEHFLPPGYRKEAKRGAVWCAISSNSLHLDCTGLFFFKQKHHSFTSYFHLFFPPKHSRLHFLFCLPVASCFTTSVQGARQTSAKVYRLFPCAFAAGFFYLSVLPVSDMNTINNADYLQCFAKAARIILCIFC